MIKAKFYLLTLCCSAIMFSGCEDADCPPPSAPKADFTYGFEKWVKGVEDQEPDMTFYEVDGGWSSSNTGAHFLKAFGMTDRYVVTETADAHSGSKAAQIVTIDSKGMNIPGLVVAPKVTSGSLFLGKFIVNMENTLLSTKFGVEFNSKPLSLTGFYKYTPGPVYYRCESQATCDIAVVDPNTVDQCSINAVLYEVTDYTDEAQYLTGVDVMDPTKLTAVAVLEDGTAKAKYTQFEMKFNYLKPYDPAKKYRFSIICSSSKDGDKFNGAPGSTLTVDDFEVFLEKATAE